MSRCRITVHSPISRYKLHFRQGTCDNNYFDPGLFVRLLRMRNINPNCPLELEQVLCVVEHILCLENEDLASYVKRIGQVRRRQTHERWTENYGKLLYFLISCVTADRGTLYYLLVENQL